MNNSVHYSSKSDEWETPDELFDDLNEEFEFDLDVCANKRNAKCKLYYTEEDNALVLPWDGVSYMNPPYGRNIKAWVEKARSEALKGNTVVCLLPARTDTKWWHENCMMAAEIRF